MRSGEVVAYVGLGSNLDDRAKHITHALAALRATPGVRVGAVSPLVETEPVGGPPQGPYLNGAVELFVTLPPRALLERLLAIEAEAGRVRGASRNEPRCLDLDLLFYGDARIDEPGLVVPHPRLHQRSFVLEPLRHIAPDFVHPVLGRSVASLARDVAA
jgi:2-amino-4-hydroxy-6-hydroxymethyldihydropteridine diphosphokinase